MALKRKSTTSKVRTFVSVSSNGKETGRYVSKTPAGAAKKAGIRILKKRNQQSTTVTVRETTAGSKKRVYTYVVKSVKLTPRKVVIRDGKRIVYQYKTVVMAKK